MSVLARKYNLSNPNSIGNLENGHETPLKKDIGLILPETVGSIDSLFEQKLPMSGELENKSLDGTQKQQTYTQDNDAQIHSNDSSLDIHFNSLDVRPPSLNMSTIDTINDTANQDGTLLTSFQNDSVLDDAEQDSSVPDQSVTDFSDGSMGYSAATRF